MATIRCGVAEGEYCEYGECSAEEIEVDEELTASGYLQLCQTYKEED